MKTIAVLTDFSKRSEHAARYAWQLAQKINANILLYNAFLVPDFSSAAVQVGWPDEGYDQIKSERESKLRALTLKLTKELKEKSFNGAYLPEINYQCEEGVVANNIADLADNKNVVLIVIGTHGVDDKSAFMMGNNCVQIIESATIPLLVVPENASIRSIEKFVFATDNSISDIDYINSLASLAKCFSAEILVTNVNEEHKHDEHEASSNLFCKEIVAKVKYHDVSYRRVINHSVKSGIEWLIENVVFDVLVMVHRKHESFNNFLKPSITQKIADRVYVPLLVFPYPVESLPNY